MQQTASTDAIYDQAGFGAALPRGSRPALVVVDLTRGFTEPGFDTGADLSAEVAATAELVDTAHAAGVPVVFTVISYSAAELASGAITWLRKATGMTALRDGSAAVDIDPRLPRADTDVVLVKKGASAFAGTHLSALLTGWGTDTVVVCGATTSGCVRATAVDAITAGWPVLVPRECVGDRATGPHEAALFDLQAKYADVVPAAEAAQVLAAASPEVTR